MEYSNLIAKCEELGEDNTYVYINLRGEWRYIPLSNFKGDTFELKLDDMSVHGEVDHILFTDDNERVYFNDIIR